MSDRADELLTRIVGAWDANVHVGLCAALDAARAYLKPHELTGHGVSGFYPDTETNRQGLIAETLQRASPPHAEPGAMEPCPHYKWTAKKNCPERAHAEPVGQPRLASRLRGLANELTDTHDRALVLECVRALDASPSAQPIAPPNDARLAALRDAMGRCEGHTYCSNNADYVRGFQHGCAACYGGIKAAYDAALKSAGHQPPPRVRYVGQSTAGQSGPASPPHAEPEQVMNEPAQSYRFALQVIAAGEASDPAKLALEALTGHAEPVGQPVAFDQRIFDNWVSKANYHYKGNDAVMDAKVGWKAALAETPLYASPSAQPIAPPREPTHRMLAAGEDAFLNCALTQHGLLNRVWTAMYDAALKSAGE